MELVQSMQTDSLSLRNMHVNTGSQFSIIIPQK